MMRFIISAPTSGSAVVFLLAGIVYSNTNSILISISLWLMVLVVQGMAQDFQLEKKQATE